MALRPRLKNSSHFVACLLLMLFMQARPEISENIPLDLYYQNHDYLKSNLEHTVVMLGQTVSALDRKFLSIGIDSGEVRWKFKGFDFSSRKLQNLAAALRPSNFRLGGTSADFLIFDPDADDEAIPYPKDMIWETRYDESDHLEKDPVNYTMSGKLWSRLTNFSQSVGWDMMFDFNVFFWRKDGTWNPFNAAELLNYSATRQIPMPAFQLGNEPNSFKYNFNVTIPAQVLLTDFTILKDLISHYSLYKNSQLVGPDVTSLGRHTDARTYLEQFLCAGAYRTMSAIGLHQYYLNGRTAQVDDFLNPNVLDQMKTELDFALNISKQCPPLMTIMMTETSSCFGGGARGLSDRYVAGFLWLDKLGLSAKYGVKSVFRQSFFGGYYALLSDHIEPRPDYYLSVLFKRLVEGLVFNISVSPHSRHLRVYANCARRDVYKYPKGAIVIYYLNLQSSNVTLTLGQFRFLPLNLFQLTPGDSYELKSQYVRLNGQKLEMFGSDLPKMEPVYHRGDVPLSAQSFGFIVVPHAMHSQCA